MGLRLPGLSRALFELFPPSLEPVYVAVTALGDPTVLTVGLALAYWVGGRRRSVAVVVAYAFTAFAAVLALKGVFALDRPAAALVAVDGHGFPSGHAVAGTVVYGGLAVELGWLDDRPKLAGLVGLGAAVALSRVALRVHYLGDVLVGVALGTTVLLAMRPVVTDLRVAFGVGTVLAIVSLVATGGHPEAWGTLGGSVGALVAVSLFGSLPERSSRREAAALAAVGVPLLVAVKVWFEAVATAPPTHGLDELVVVPAVLLLPVALDRSGLLSRAAPDEG